MTRRKQSTGDYEVGYARPPIASRFQPGQSGNPRGRPKGQKTVADDLRDAMKAKVKAVENGRTRVFTAQQVIIRGLVADAARKNLRAALAVLALEARYGSSPDTLLDPAELPPDDRDIIQGFIDQIRGSPGSDAPRPAEGEDAAPDRDPGPRALDPDRQGDGHDE